MLSARIFIDLIKCKVDKWVGLVRLEPPVIGWLIGLFVGLLVDYLTVRSTSCFVGCPVF